MFCSSFHNIEMICSLILVEFSCEAVCHLPDFFMEINHFRCLSVLSGASFGQLHFPGKLSISSGIEIISRVEQSGTYYSFNFLFLWYIPFFVCFFIRNFYPL